LHEAKAQEKRDGANQVIRKKVVFATRFGIIQHPDEYGQEEKIDAEADEQTVEVFAEPGNAVWGNSFFKGK
jgi:hypothetical protein